MQRGGRAGLVAQLPEDLQRLLIARQSLCVPTLVFVLARHVIEHAGFSAAVLHLAMDGESLLVESGRFRVMALPVVGQTEITPDGGFDRPVAQVERDAERLPLSLQCLGIDTPSAEQRAQVVERLRLGVAVPFVLDDPQRLIKGSQSIVAAAQGRVKQAGVVEGQRLTQPIPGSPPCGQ